MTFIRVFDSMIFQYRHEKYEDQRSLKKVYAKIEKDEADAKRKLDNEKARLLRK